MIGLTRTKTGQTPSEAQSFSVCVCVCVFVVLRRCLDILTLTAAFEQLLARRSWSCKPVGPLQQDMDTNDSRTRMVTERHRDF